MGRAVSLSKQKDNDVTYNAIITGKFIYFSNSIILQEEGEGWEI